MQKNKTNHPDKYTKWFLFLIGLMSFSLLSPIIITGTKFLYFFPDNAERIATIIGIMNPFIAIGAIIVTYLAYKMQLDANIEMQLNNSKLQLERQFYEMLKIHRDNVKHLHLDNMFNAITSTSNYISINGQDFIRIALDEFNKIYSLIKETNKITSNDNIFAISYYIFFYGQNSALTNGKIDRITYDLFQSKTTIYPWFANFAQGHIDQLSSYYRHLFLTVKTIVQVDEDLFTYADKRQFLRILRAQLSSAEQVLLFYNWKSGCGEQWEEEASTPTSNHFFTDYRMIHNINPKDCSNVFSKEKVLQILLKKNSNYRTLSKDDTLFELIAENSHTRNNND